jgi:hypothetical protein
MITAIFESESIFGFYPVDNFFRIEKSQTVRDVNENAKKDSGIKIAEFLLLKEKTLPTIWIVEAKYGSPRPIKQPDFDHFINEIKDKLFNSLSLFLALYFKRHSNEAELSENFQKINLNDINFKLVLVITSETYKEEWLVPLQEALYETLHPVVNRMVKIWKLSSSSVSVINKEMAKEQGLIYCADNQSSAT